MLIRDTRHVSVASGIVSPNLIATADRSQEAFCWVLVTLTPDVPKFRVTYSPAAQQSAVRRVATIKTRFMVVSLCQGD
jgi:hypothetical protein